MRTARARGFTLLEMLMAFAIGAGITGVVYFFYFGVLKTNVKASSRVDLTRLAEIELERIVRELQLAVKMVELKPDSLTFRRPQVRSWGGSGFEVNMDLDTHKFETVTYQRVPVENGRFVELQYVRAMSAPETLFRVDTLEPEIFTGWVIPKGAEETPTEVPAMEPYDRDRDVRSDLERVPLIRIRFHMSDGQDRIDIQTKAFVPPIWAQIVQPNWNPL